MKITKQTLYKKQIGRRTLTIEDAVELIKSDETKTKIEVFRQRLRTAYPNVHYPFTDKLPKLLFAGVFRKEGIKEYTGLVLLEVNHLRNTEEAEQVKQKVADYPQTLLAMVGSGGKSVKFVVPYTRPDGSLPTDRKEAELFHAHACRHALKTYEPRLSYPIELKRPDLEQGCRLSHDPEVYYNPNALAIHLEQPTAMPDESTFQENYEKRQPQKHIGETLYDHYRYVSIQYELALGYAVQKHGNLGANFDFKPLITTIGERCFGAGIGEEDCVKWTLLYLERFLSEVEIRETLHHIYQVQEGFGETEIRKDDQLQALQTREFMNRRYEFRYNTMTDAPEYRERHSFCFEFRPVTARVLNSIAQNALEEGLQLWDRDVRRYIYSDRVKDYAPIESYLKALPRWDGKDRIRPLAARIPCDNPRWQELFYRWFLSMVAHWQGRDGKHGNSVSPLLVGGQGCGKSTFCLNLLPPELKIYYTDSIDFSKKRDAELYLTRFALVNIDEFDQVSNRHQGFLKHLLQKPVVNIRKPYASQVEAVKRYASFIATSNHTDLLSDPSGSRRFICIEVKGMIENTQPIEYTQLYAQALAALDNNERYWLTHEEEQIQMQANENFSQTPLYEDLYFKYFRAASSREEGKEMSAGEIYLELQNKSGVKLPMGQITYFGRFLVKQGVPVRKAARGRVYWVVEK